MTRFEQLQKIGINRVGTPSRGFRYKRADGKKVSAADLKRIDELKVPPAWTDVWINAAAGGAVLKIDDDDTQHPSPDTQYLSGRGIAFATDWRSTALTVR